MTRPPHVQRCVQRQVFGTGVHARSWQCTLTDPHPDRGHDYGIDAEDFGRVLPEQPPWWLVGKLRMAAASLRHERRQVGDVAAVASQLADLVASGTPVSATTADWVRKNNPTAGLVLDEGDTWHMPRGTDL